jgi:hypothetical protein
MKIHDFRFEILAIYGLLLCGSVGAIVYSNVHLYDSVVIIEKKDDTLRQANLSIPMRIDIQSENLGHYTISDEASIQKIWQNMHDITADSAPDAISNTTQDHIRLSCTISYLNGSQDTFLLGRYLQLNGQVYSDFYKQPLINSLESDLLQQLYSCSRIAALLPTAPVVQIYTGTAGNPGRALAAAERKELSKALLAATDLQGQKKQFQLATQQNRPVAHIRIELQAVSSPDEIPAANLINIDLYESGCFAVQYLGDSNGRHLYFTKDLLQYLPPRFSQEVFHT